MTTPVILDSFALLSLFHKETGWEKVENILREQSAVDEKALLSRINWGEIYYILKRRVGKLRTQEALALLDQLPIEVLSVDDELIREAAEIKAEYPISYADAFCTATALRFNGQIITSDPEFKAVEKIVSVIWLTALID